MSIAAAAIYLVATPVAWYWALRIDPDKAQQKFEMQQNDMTYGDSVSWVYDVLQHAGDEGWDPDHFETHDANGEIVDVYFGSKEENQWAHSCLSPLTQCSILWPQSWQ